MGIPMNEAPNSQAGRHPGEATLLPTHREVVAAAYFGLPLVKVPPSGSRASELRVCDPRRRET